MWCVQIIAAARDVQEKTEIYAPFNILPLDSAGAFQPIMQLEEVSVLKWFLWSLFCVWNYTDVLGFVYMFYRLRQLFLRFLILVAWTGLVHSSKLARELEIWICLIGSEPCLGSRHVFLVPNKTWIGERLWLTNFFCICIILWLTSCYVSSPQRDNVRNQREHLILLLANNHIRLHPKPEPLNKVYNCLLHRPAIGKTVV